MKGLKSLFMLREIFLHMLLCNNLFINCITLDFIYCIGWLHNLASAPVLETTMRTVIITCSGDMILVLCTKAGHRLVSLLFLCSVLTRLRVLSDTFTLALCKRQPVASYKFYTSRRLTQELSSDSCNHKGSVFG